MASGRSGWREGGGENEDGAPPREGPLLFMESSLWMAALSFISVEPGFHSFLHGLTLFFPQTHRGHTHFGAGSVVLIVWSWDQQCQHHLGVY